MRNMIAQAVNWMADTTGIRVMPDSLPHPRDPDVQTLKIPGYVQSQLHTCGFVAGLMITHYFRPEYPVARLFEKIRPHTTWGVSRSRLRDTLRGCGLRVSWRSDLDFRGIVDAIDHGRPIAMLVNTRTPGVMHWVVCYGYGMRPNRVFVAANGLPLLSRKEYPYSVFQSHWWAHKGFGLVCAGPR